MSDLQKWVMVFNVLETAIFAVVACYFGKWWIILFSYLFFLHIEHK